MAHKKFLTTAKRTFSLEVLGLPEKKLSDVLLKEAEEFRKRNSLALVGHTIPDKKPIFKCCSSCLKAHLIKKAEEKNLDKDLMEVLFLMVEHETGHHGYYLDGEEMIKI